MAFCQNCGNPLSAGERFGPNCGTQTAAAQQSAPQPHTPPPYQAGPQQPQAPKYGAAQPSPVQQGASVAGGAAVGAMGGMGTQQPYVQQTSAPTNPYATSTPTNPYATSTPPPYQQGAAAGAGAPQKETLKEMFFTAHGRLNRKPYILRGLLLWILSLIISGVTEVMAESDSVVILLLSLVLLGVWSALCVASIMLVIRRWHDLGKSGWFTLLLLVPLVNIAVAIYLWVKKGDEGPNNYGEDPLAQFR